MKLVIYRARGLRGAGYRWTLVADNGSKLANGGQGYSRRVDMEAAIEKALGGVWDGPDFWRDTRVDGADDIRVEDRTR